VGRFQWPHVRGAMMRNSWDDMTNHHLSIYTDAM
jgi:hypothetical protein